jgi:excisionase family DNA binding protein
MPDQTSADGPSGVLEPLAVSVKEAARLLGVHPWTVYRMLDDGEVEGAKIRGRRLVIYRSLVALTMPPAAEESA